MRPKTPSILLYAPLPPPMHGSAYAAQLLAESELASRFQVIVLNTNYVTQLNELGRVSFKKISLFVKNIFKAVNICRNNSIDFIIFVPSFNTRNILRDSLFIFVIFSFTRTKLIAWVHSNDVFDAFKDNRFIEYLLHATYKKVSHMVLAGGALYNNFSTFVPSDKVTVIHNGIPSPQKRSAQNSHNQSTIKVLYLSNMIESKGWKDLFIVAERICAVHQNVEFSFYGGIPSHAMENEINKLFKESLFSSKILYKGSADKTLKNETLQISDIFVLPTYYKTEAFPLVILEAMSYGIPVISTHIGAISEAVLDGQGGMLIEPRNLDQLFSSLDILIRNKEIRKRMGVFSKNYFDKYFTDIEITNQWIDFIEKLHREIR